MTFSDRGDIITVIIASLLLLLYLGFFAWVLAKIA
jgi:hypothetical protein